MNNVKNEARVVATVHAIQARGLSKVYGEGPHAVHALRGVDLDIRRGEFVSIMGPSGSGKSTLLQLLGLLDNPTGGRIRIQGREVTHAGARERALLRRSTIGFVFQAFHLLPRATALQNVTLPLGIAGVPRRERRERAERVLAAVGLADRARHLATEMSGGQKQRVAIALALALDPPILLADEPTGNLDSVTSREIMELFRTLNRRGRTVIQVTHDPAMARHADRILHVRDGVVLREERRGGGTPHGPDAARPPARRGPPAASTQTGTPGPRPAYNARRAA